MKQKQKSKFEKGFTLIELLVVISIISFLASILLSNIRKGQIQASDVTKLKNITTLGQAMDLYFQDHNAYPAAGVHQVGGFGSYISDADPQWATQLGSDLKPYINNLPNQGRSYSAQIVTGGGMLGTITYPTGQNFAYFVLSSKVTLPIYKNDGSTDHYACMQPGSYILASYMDQMNKYQNTALIATPQQVYYDYVVYGGNRIEPVYPPSNCP